MRCKELTTGREEPAFDNLLVVEFGEQRILSQLHFFQRNIPQNWLDYQLNWNISEYGGVKSIRVHPKLIWTPDLLMYNRCLSFLHVERMLICSLNFH